MSERHRAVVSIMVAFVIAVFCMGSGQSRAKTVDVNIFERFRNEMAVDYSAAAGKYMTPGALAKWNAFIAPYFIVRDKQINHFFATSMMVPKRKGADLFMIFFNPWVDGALLTQWKGINKTWKMVNYYLASGERVRGLATPASTITRGHIPPIWLWQKGSLLGSIFAYYTDMRARLIAKPVQNYISWFLLSQREAGLDLLRVKLRMAARQKTADAYINTGSGGPALSGAFSRLKYDALTGNKRALKAYSKDGGLIAMLKPEIIKTLKPNWVFHKNGVYTTLLSSSIAPRYLVFMNSADNGKIDGVLFGNLEIMATIKRTTAAPASVAPARPAQATRKVQKYKAPNGDQIEITTEKRGGKVIMTTRRNGVVTEVLSF